MNFAVVKIEGVSSLESILTIIRESPNKTSETTSTIGEATYKVDLATNLFGIEGFNIGMTENLQVDGNPISCTGVSIYTERAKRPEYWLQSTGQLKANIDLINSFQADFIIYELNSNVYALGSAGINRVKALLKDAFELQSDEMITEDFKISEDILYWIFKRFIDTPAESLLNDEQLHVTSLESYVGKTRDKVNAMRGEGDGISVILGTLAFLFNNEELKSIRPTIQYGNEKLLIEIGLTGTFKLWGNSYRGREFRQQEGKRKELMLALYVNLVIIPLLVRSYHENLKNETWSKHLKIDFIKRLGERITREVASVLDRIEKVPENPPVDFGELKHTQSELALDDVRELIDDEEILPIDDESEESDKNLLDDADKR